MTQELKIRKTVFSQEALSAKAAELGRRISRDYAGRDLVVVGVLKGSVYFLCDLTRAIDIPVEVDFIAIGAIPGATSRTGVVRIVKDLDADITGKHVLIVEDIIRTGLTTAYLVQNLDARKPAGVQVCALLVNPRQKMINVPIAYFGYEITDQWLVGYGMDVDERGRNLPYIAQIDKKDSR